MHVRMQDFSHSLYRALKAQFKDELNGQLPLEAFRRDERHASPQQPTRHLAQSGEQLVQQVIVQIKTVDAFVWA